MAELRFDGKVALVTGGGRGLGRAHARLLAARGARVVVNDPGVSLTGDGADRGPAQAVVDEIVAAGGEAVANFDSVASAAGARAMVDQAIATFGGIDVVVNNAGNFLPGRPFAETSDATFDGLLQVHLMGTVNVIRAAWAHMIAQRYGRIVNTVSHVGYLGSTGRFEYAAAKAAIHGLTRTLAPEAQEHGIAVNAVAPGGITRPVQEMRNMPESFVNGAFAPELVSPTVAWLAHADCAVNGEVFGVMAGTTTRILIAETEGFSSPAPTPEAIRDNFDRILDSDAVDDSRLDFGASGEARGMALVARYEAL